MRILMLTQWFTPEPDFKGLPFAKELVKRGHEVQVLTGFPNYPGGKVYRGYKISPLQREIIEGISIIRVPLYPSHDGSSIRRMINYISFAFSAALLAPILIRQADVVYVYHAPATIALPAIVLKILRRIPFVYDINDLWPDSLAASNMLNNRFLLKCVDMWCDLTYRMASHVVVVTPGFKTKLLKRGVPESNINVIYNWCDEVQRTPGRNEVLAGETGMAGRFNLVFAGTMGKAQALDAVIDAAKLVALRQPAVQFVFIGGGIEVERLKGRVDAESIDNCLFLPRRPVSEIGPILGLADVLLVHLRDDPLFRITIPSKTQAYMAAKRPILMAMRGDAVDLVQRAAAGICCAPEAPEEIAEAVLAFHAMPQEEREQLGANGLTYYERELSLKTGVERFEELFHETHDRNKECRYMKRLFDLVSTGSGLLCIWPLLLVLALLVRLKHGSPVLFRQTRPGLHGRPFKMYKFRTMTNACDANGNLLPDETRLTSLGKFLRSTSLDEFPALINVLKGEMSLVGPRPLLMEYLPLYSSEQARRHEILPGITGWAQVNGRNAISWDDKFKLDVWYVENHTLWLDVKILWKTVTKVFNREGISQEGQATMEKFRGTPV